jgi:predicted  nucleic acid-binding Zn-ribbon protein
MEKIKQLEQLVDLTLLFLNDLNSEKNHLEQRVRELEKEQESSFKEHEKIKDSQEKIKKLGLSKRKLEKERSSVRVKVKKALQKLEKMDFV